ncbi:MetQ/NlpA family ABC transporter substrate-binding protein [Neobacillus mesonae]|nr:MetQ/NlpA family ABC transporter substrate-binding protein [Neobacillus mesonae]
MNKKKRGFQLTALIMMLSMLLAACGDPVVENNSTDMSKESVDEDQTIVIAAPEGTGKEFVEKTIKDLFEKQGYTLQISEITDPSESATKLADGTIDVYLNSFMDNKENQLTTLTSVPTEPLTLYSNTFKDEDQITDGSTVIIPEDPQLLGRALMMLEDEKLIGIRTGAAVSQMSVETDVTDNPKNLKFEAVPADQLADRVKNEALIIVPLHTAQEAGLTEDAALDEEDVPDLFANQLVVRAKDQGTNFARTLKETIQSTEFEKLTDQHYPNYDKPEWMED